MNEDDCQVIKVPKFCIPAGSELVEAYQTASEIIVMGEPGDDDDHDCDQMGCGTLSHVMYRFKLGKEQP